MKTKLIVQTCNKCGYKWIPRIKNPKACPSCKQYIKKGEK